MAHHTHILTAKTHTHEPCYTMTYIYTHTHAHPHTSSHIGTHSHIHPPWHTHTHIHIRTQTVRWKRGGFVTKTRVCWRAWTQIKPCYKYYFRRYEIPLRFLSSKSWNPNPKKSKNGKELNCLNVCSIFKVQEEVMIWLKKCHAWKDTLWRHKVSFHAWHLT